jgi:hypothetical protein
VRQRGKRTAAWIEKADPRVLSAEEAVLLLAEPYRRMCAAVHIAPSPLPLEEPWEALFLNDAFASATAGHYDAHNRYFISNLVTAPGRLGVMGAHVTLRLLKAACDTGKIADVVGTVHKNNLPIVRALRRAFDVSGQVTPLGYVLSYKEL